MLPKVISLETVELLGSVDLPIIILLDPVVNPFTPLVAPPSYPIQTLSDPLVTNCPADEPKYTLLSPVVAFLPE